MKPTKLTFVAPASRCSSRFWGASHATIRTLIFGLFAFSIAVSVQAADLKIMKMGLGSGTITSAPMGINCGGDCIETFGSAVSVRLTATADAGSVFVRWEGDATGSSLTTSPISMNVNRSVRAVFNLSPDIPTMTDLTPEGIQRYLNDNMQVNTPARFLRALPTTGPGGKFLENWILMTRSESLQTGTAEYPRILLPSEDAKFVFTIGLVEHGSFPGSHPNAIEFMQWDPVQKNFRFHEIVLNPIPDLPSSGGPVLFPARITRGVKIDDAKCTKCHSTRNVLNPPPFNGYGTNGIPPGSVIVKNKPNWDAYDSWGGMMPFNRDRIYQGSVEAAAFRKIFNLWTWWTNDEVRAVIEQLKLQPPDATVPMGADPLLYRLPSDHIITRREGGTNDGHINFDFDLLPPVFSEPAPIGTAPSINTNYSFDALFGSGTPTTVVRGGNFVTLHHSEKPGFDEGRGVQLFDLLGGADGDPDGNLNAQRIAHELINHNFATSNFPIDVRPIALAISKSGLLAISGSRVVSTGTLPTLAVDLSFFNARNGLTIDQLLIDTDTRAKSLPRRKADIQKMNLARTDRTNDVYLSGSAPADGLIQKYGLNTAEGISIIDERLRQEVFRRPSRLTMTEFPFEPLGSPDATVMGGILIDRELHDIPGFPQNTTKIALFRYFLEPLGVSVDKWSMGVRGRSRTYTFADVFGAYLNVFERELRESLRTNPVPGFPNAYNNDDDLIRAINAVLSRLPAAIQVPKYTDVQRIFNKSCIECHGGLGYPPYSNFPGRIDLSEDDAPPTGAERLTRAYDNAIDYTTIDLATSELYRRLIAPSEGCTYPLPFNSLMPCGGPALSKTDIETIGRWIVGPRSRPFTHGDPHIGTIDGVNYDFQAAGEFVLLRDEGMEVQTRQTAVATETSLGPNAHTGLTSCVSLNTAIAVRVGRNRITYQPNLNGEPDPSGLQLRVNGELQKLDARGIPLPSGGRILQTSAPGGIQIEARGGTTIVITPGWWEHYQLWYLNVDARHVRATEGLMGQVETGNWLPAMPDGTLLGPKPQDLQERYKILYGVFGKAWQVNDSNSLFDYAPGTSTENFSIENWPNGESSQSCFLPKGYSAKPPQKTINREEAEQYCAGILDENMRANCIKDVMITGDPGFAKTYRAADKIAQNKLPKAPTLVFPVDFKTDITLPVKFIWNQTTDADGDPLDYKLYVWLAGEKPNNNNALPVESGKSLTCPLIVGLIGCLLFALLYFLGWLEKTALKVSLAIAILAAAIIAYYYCNSGTGTKTIVNLEPGKTYFWKVIVEDGKGGTVESETRRFEVK